MHVPLTPIRCLYRAVDLYPQKTGVVSGDRRLHLRPVRRALRTPGRRPARRGRPARRPRRLSELQQPPAARRLLRRAAGRRHRHAAQRAAHRRRTDRHPQPCRTARADLRKRFRAAGGAVAPGLPGRGTLDRDRASPTRICCRAAASPRPDTFSFDENAIAELFYTSGSTGTPKGVMLSHRTLYLHALAVAATFNHDDSAVELHTIPLFHANGWGRPQASTMIGLKQVMVRRFDPAQVLRLIQEEKATAMSLVPTMANALLNCPDLGKFDTLQPAARFMLGGAASSPELIARLEQAFHCRVHGRLRAHRNLSGGHRRARQEHRGLRRRGRPPAPSGHGRMAHARLRDPRGGSPHARRAARHADHRRSRDPRRQRHGRLLQGARRPPPPS